MATELEKEFALRFAWIIIESWLGTDVNYGEYCNFCKKVVELEKIKEFEHDVNCAVIEAKKYHSESCVVIEARKYLITPT